MEKNSIYSLAFDRSIGKGMTAAEADAEQNDYVQSTVQQRLSVSFYLASIAYDFSIAAPPKMDKTIFECREFV